MSAIDRLNKALLEARLAAHDLCVETKDDCRIYGAQDIAENVSDATESVSWWLKFWAQNDTANIPLEEES